MEPWPSRADTADSGTPEANRCEKWECLRECRLAPFGSLSRRNSSDTAAEIESGWSGSRQA
jgi:hypothetical protein